MAGGKRRRSGLVLILVALILILGLAATFLLLRNTIFSPANAEELETEATTIPQQEMVEILVMAQPVKRGTVISENVLQRVYYPRAELIAGLFITEFEDAVEKRAKYDLDAGIPLTYNHLTDSDTGSLAAFQIPPGMVAVSIPIDDDRGITAVSYAIMPGDHVNVIGALLFVDIDTDFQTRLPNSAAIVNAPGPAILPGEEEGELAAGELILSNPLTLQIIPIYPSFVGRSEIEPNLRDPYTGSETWIHVIPSEEEGQRPRLISQALIQDAIVLGVGEFPITEAEPAVQVTPTPGPETSGAQQPVEESAAPPEAPDLVTLIVSPQDAITINYLLLSGAKLSLALRSAGDDHRTETEAVTLQFLLEQYNIPYPSKLPYATEPKYPYDDDGRVIFEYPNEEETGPIVVPPQ